MTTPATTLAPRSPADVRASHTPLMSSAAPSLALHQARVGALPDGRPEQLRSEVHRSGLDGRGGAGFPTGRKLEAVAAGGRAVVVANGAEGEPASSKDTYLLRHAPHLVLDGLRVAAQATGARAAYVYAPQQILDTVIRHALRERADPVRVRLVASPPRYLAGEASAVVNAINGRAALPYHESPRIFERGVGGRPTLVQNVETLAQLALIARFGADWFRSFGTTTEPGTRLVTLSGAVARPGVYELDAQYSLLRAVSLGGGLQPGVRALLVGGYHGGWVPFDAAQATIGFSRRDLAPFGASPGAGVVVALPPDVCGLRAGADLVGYLAGQGAQQCGPCRNGLPSMASTLRALAYGRPTAELWSEVERLAQLVSGRGACHHPDGTVRLVRSTLRVFADEVSRHRDGHCSAAAVRGVSSR